MSESNVEKLSRFTPESGNLSSAEILFRAGRASARPNRLWKLLTGTLILSQALTCVFLWPRSSDPDSVEKPKAPPQQLPPVPEEDLSPPSSPSPSLMLLQHQYVNTKPNPTQVLAQEDLIPASPPLRARSTRFEDILEQ